MRVKYFFWVLFSVMSLNTVAQKYVSEKGVITFFSEAAIEDIKAENLNAISIFNVQTSDIAFSVSIREFQFEKKLMQEHFNEKYMDSGKYPKSTFSGKLVGFVSTNTSEVQQVKARGKLVIHGVTKEVEIPGTVEITSPNILMKAKFTVRLENYKIKIPQLMWQNIAEEVEVSLEFTYKPQ
jgi:polyisoprenoid-binding protein YceI